MLSGRFLLTFFLVATTCLAGAATKARTETTSSAVSTAFATSSGEEHLVTPGPEAPGKGNLAELVKGFGQLPLYFVENQGQLDEQVAYYIQGRNMTIYFTPTGVTFSLYRVKRSNASAEAGLKHISLDEPFQRRRRNDLTVQRWVVKLDFVGANPSVRPVGRDQTHAIISYFKGPKEKWHTGLPTYSGIVYENLWPGIDLIYRGNTNELKQEFIVRPQADPDRIRLAYRGAEVAINDPGQLVVSTPYGTLADEKPHVYQSALLN